MPLRLGLHIAKYDPAFSNFSIAFVLSKNKKFSSTNFSKLLIPYGIFFDANKVECIELKLKDFWRLAALDEEREKIAAAVAKVARRATEVNILLKRAQVPEVLVAINPP